MADPYKFSFDVAAFLEEQEVADTSVAPKEGVMKKPEAPVEEAPMSNTDRLKKRFADTVSSFYSGTQEIRDKYNKAQETNPLLGRDAAQSEWMKALSAPAVTTTVLGPDMDTMAMQDAQEQAAIRSASGITESLGRPAPAGLGGAPAQPETPVIYEAAATVTNGADSVVDRTAPAGLMTRPVQGAVSEVDTDTADAMATPETGAVSTSLRPEIREEDSVVNKAILLNKTATTLSKRGIKDQVRDIVGDNDYAAGILGAFTKESGSNFSKLEENTNYSLANTKGVFSAKRVADALKAVTPAVREKINAGGRDKSFGEALMSHYGGGGKYHGRGLIHITHDYNYKAVGDRIGVDLVANPDLVKDPRYAVPAALAFLELNDYFNPNKPITKDRLHRIVNRWAGEDIKNSRWKAVEGFREDRTSVETSKRPQLRPKKDS
jgi:predicted chitinase